MANDGKQQQTHSFITISSVQKTSSLCWTIPQHAILEPWGQLRATITWPNYEEMGDFFGVLPMFSRHNAISLEVSSIPEALDDSTFNFYVEILDLDTRSTFIDLRRIHLTRHLNLTNPVEFEVS